MVMGDWSKIEVGFSLMQKHCNCPMEEAPHCSEGKDNDHWNLILA